MIEELFQQQPKQLIRDIQSLHGHCATLSSRLSSLTHLTDIELLTQQDDATLTQLLQQSQTILSNDAEKQLVESLKTFECFSQTSKFMHIIRSELEAEWILAPMLLSSSIASLNGSTILDRHLVLVLARFIGKELMPRIRPRLLYRASSDGWRASDFYRRVVGHAPTSLVLVKVKQSGNIFGGYFGVRIPSPPTEDEPDKDIMDPSGTSFLFSLVNREHRPLRFKLDLTRKAPLQVQQDSDFCFGARVVEAGKVSQYPTCVLWNGGELANHTDGVVANSIKDSETAHEIDLECEREAGLEAPTFELDKAFLTGNLSFSCQEIECYAMS